MSKDLKSRQEINKTHNPVITRQVEIIMNLKTPISTFYFIVYIILVLYELSFNIVIIND